MENAAEYPDVVELFTSLLKSEDVKLKREKEVNFNSQNMENAAKYPDVVELFLSLLKSEGVKVKRKKGKESKSKLQESFEQSLYKPEPRNPSNSVHAYISYWIAVYLFNGEKFSINSTAFYKELFVQKVKLVAGDVEKVINNDKYYANWITFSELLSTIKYSANALQREYVSFFSKIGDRIHQIVEIKVGNKKKNNTRERRDANSSFEKLLKTKEIDKKNSVKTLIKNWVNEYVKHQFGRNIDEFVDNLILLIPYTYLMCLKTKSIARWEWKDFLQQFEEMDSKSTDELLDAASPGDKEFDPSHPLLFTSLMLERPRIFVKEYVVCLECHSYVDYDGDDFDSTFWDTMISIESGRRISLSYSVIFHASFFEEIEPHRYPDSVYSGGDETKKQAAIYKFISRWTERRKITSFAEVMTFTGALLIKFRSIVEELGSWVEKRVEINEALHKYYTLIKAVFDAGGFNYSSIKNPVTSKKFLDDWIEKLSPYCDSPEEPDVTNFANYLNRLSDIEEKSKKLIINSNV